MAIRIGRIFGIPIEIDYSWLFIFGLFAYVISTGHFGSHYPHLSPLYHFVLGIATTLLFFASLIGHELSHSYVAKRAGIPIAGITLFIFGGVAKMKAEPKSPGDEAKMALAGPAFSVVAAVVAWLIAFLSPIDVISTIFGYVSAANAIVAVFNMIPGFPLDGGRVLRAAIWAGTKDLTLATRAATLSGQAFGWGLIGLGLAGLLFAGSFGGIWFVLIGWFLNNAAHSSYRQLLMRRALEGVEVSDVMSPVSEIVDPNITLDTLVHDYFLRTHADSYPVADGAEVAKMVRLEDVRGVPQEKWRETTVDMICHPISDECTISASENAWDAVEKLTNGCPSKVVVYNDGHVVGTIAEENLARLLKTRSELELDKAA